MVWNGNRKHFICFWGLGRSEWTGKEDKFNKHKDNISCGWQTLILQVLFIAHLPSFIGILYNPGNCRLVHMKDRCKGNHGKQKQKKAESRKTTLRLLWIIRILAILMQWSDPQEDNLITIRCWLTGRVILVHHHLWGQWDQEMVHRNKLISCMEWVKQEEKNTYF